LEALRFKHNRALLTNAAAPGERVSPTAPEALTLAHESDDVNANTTYLYPDPPLGREELEVLQRLRPNARFITPLTKLAAQFSSKHVEPKTICVSISQSDDLRRYGLSDEHFHTLTDEIHLYLLVAGLKIAYGGTLKGDFSKADNFTLRLFELVRTYSQLAKGVEAPPLEGAVLNVAPWPLWLGYTDDEITDLFGGEIARYDPAPRPSLPWTDDEIFPGSTENRPLPSDTPRRRYAWARGLTLMRERITAQSQARLVIGGKLSGFSGLVPGLVEEAWLSVTQRKPLYLIGGFGGAARAVVDVIQGLERTDLSEAWTQEKMTGYVPATDLYKQHGESFRSVEQMSTEIASEAKGGIANLLNNRLDEDENRELMYCTDPQRIAQLVLSGLGRI
jgi:hypothetical protein